MGKQEDIIQGRNEGMAFAFRIAREKGVDELEKEIARRNISGINARLTHMDGYDSWADLLEVLEEETHVKLEIRKNDN